MRRRRVPTKVVAVVWIASMAFLAAATYYVAFVR
jgi:hypothetical protein